MAFGTRILNNNSQVKYPGNSYDAAIKSGNKPNFITATNEDSDYVHVADERPGAIFRNSIY